MYASTLSTLTCRSKVTYGPLPGGHCLALVPNGAVLGNHCLFRLRSTSGCDMARKSSIVIHPTGIGGRTPRARDAHR